MTRRTASRIGCVIAMIVVGSTTVQYTHVHTYCYDIGIITIITITSNTILLIAIIIISVLAFLLLW